MNIIVIVAGLLSGAAAAMGLGGGFVLIICLTMFEGVSVGVAGGVNLLFFLPIAAISVTIHAKNRLIDWKTVLLCLATGAAGAIAGSLLHRFMPENMLNKAFAVLLIYVGLREVFHKKLSQE